MTLGAITKKKGPFEKARSNVETVANNLYYSLTLNTYIIKLMSMPLPTRTTIEEITNCDFVIGNLIEADAIMQRAQRISA